MELSLRRSTNTAIQTHAHIYCKGRLLVFPPHSILFCSPSSWALPPTRVSGSLPYSLDRPSAPVPTRVPSS